MKKNYIRPESKLFAINFAENIALQSGSDDAGNIHWGGIFGHPGSYYSNTPGAEVVRAPNEMSYKDEFQDYILKFALDANYRDLLEQLLGCNQ